MIHTAPRSKARTGLLPVVIGLAVVAVAVVGVLLQHPASLAGLGEIVRGVGGGAPSKGRTVTAADGVLPDGVTVFDVSYAGVANLDRDLVAALGSATTAAAADGIQIDINSGWRSRAYQNRLLSQAVSEYGSVAEAARWVATADTSPHVSGEAVDVGPSPAADWLSEHGVQFGLCQIYRNEPWHFELRPAAVRRGCPRMYADPTQDPRMQQ